MTITNSYVGVPGSVTRVDIPMINQTNIVKTSQSLDTKSGLVKVIYDFVLTSSTAAKTLKIRQTLTMRPDADLSKAAFDRGDVSAISLRVITDMGRADDVLDTEVVEPLGITIAISPPFVPEDTDELLEVISLTYALFIKSVDAGTHLPESTNLFSALVGAPMWK